ncbi:FMN-binding negative transcriptional regulator [Sphingomonas montana]|uniref:FMN-binding negative transcriptional regulator n=1 Tax=Sphingomonas montana TaxID=1843236 RepID=UPI00096C5DD4|nr:FMN-binding negative transcriptional regulator [Sphingomonas montana]
MHYTEYKHSDPALVREMVETFPFATIIANGPDGPVTAQAPLTFRDGSGAAGAVEFHLAIANPITDRLASGEPITVMVHGPGAHVSPTWFSASFPTPTSERNRTAPTYNYVSLAMGGRVKHRDDQALQVQIGDLVFANEGPDGWRLDELAPELWDGWRGAIRLYRIEITRFDLTAKLSLGDVPEDRPGVVDGLRRRGIQDDQAMALLVDGFAAGSGSLTAGLRALRMPPARHSRLARRARGEGRSAHDGPSSTPIPVGIDPRTAAGLAMHA